MKFLPLWNKALFILFPLLFSAIIVVKHDSFIAYNLSSLIVLFAIYLSMVGNVTRSDNVLSAILICLVGFLMPEALGLSIALASIWVLSKASFPVMEIVIYSFVIFILGFTYDGFGVSSGSQVLFGILVPMALLFYKKRETNVFALAVPTLYFVSTVSKEMALLFMLVAFVKFDFQLIKASAISILLVHSGVAAEPSIALLLLSLLAPWSVPVFASIYYGKNLILEISESISLAMGLLIGVLPMSKPGVRLENLIVIPVISALLYEKLYLVGDLEFIGNYFYLALILSLLFLIAQYFLRSNFSIIESRLPVVHLKEERVLAYATKVQKNRTTAVSGSNSVEITIDTRNWFLSYSFLTIGVGLCLLLF
ncbi:MAG: hypothetical protein AB8E15_03545 [Bdellovibrionales bacterium]